MRTYCEKIDWKRLSREVRTQQRHREKFAPTISTYRWWARRPHALIGELLEQAAKDIGPSIYVSDPMCGGGTVGIEAARRGFRVYCQDINPWATAGLRTVLSPVNPDHLEAAGKQLLRALDPLRHKLYSFGDGSDRTEILCQLYVRTYECQVCEETNFLFPTPVVALNKRIDYGGSHAWLGCGACGHIFLRRLKDAGHCCPQCDARQPANPFARKLSNYRFDCAHCGSFVELEPERIRSSSWVPILAHVLRQDSRFFLPGVAGDRGLDPVLDIEKKLRFCIKKGIETTAILKGGVRYWTELYTQRQLKVLDSAISCLQAMDVPDSVRRRLLLAVCGFAEMGGFLTRWDPRYLKVYEGVANHHYARTTLTAELNPLAPCGRGTLRRRIQHAVKAARWFPGTRNARVVTGTSERQKLPDRTVDLVITDPPYFDSVQYGELSRVFGAMAYACGLHRTKNPRLQREAVPNRVALRAEQDYADILLAIMKETSRTLKGTGAMVLTFRSSKLIAWECLAYALRAGGFFIVGLAVVHAENEKDFSKRHRQGFTSDLVLECVKNGRERIKRARLLTAPQTGADKNLAAVGLAVSAYCLNSTKTPSIRTSYLRNLRQLDAKQLIS